MTSKDAHRIRLVQDGRRFRIVFAGETVADTVDAVLLCEEPLHPVIYVPPADIAAGVLSKTEKTTHCPFKGDASYWTVSAGGRTAENAAWSYESPIAHEAIKGHLAFDWKAMDSFWEEETELLAHPRNPFIRIDTLPSGRRIRVTAAGQELADTTRAVILYETGLPARYYIPAADVAMDLFSDSPTRSHCPYKGVAAYKSLTLGGAERADVAWYYSDPRPEVALIKDCLCFYPERVDAIEVSPR